jgi:hypothetical protein
MTTWKIMNKIYSLFIFTPILILSSISYSQAKEVKALYFEGIEKSNEPYLNSVFGIKIGDQTDEIEIDKGVERLESLEIFSLVEKELKDSLGGICITIRCDEKGTISPLLSAGKIEDAYWFRLGAQAININGTSIKAGGYYQFFDRNSFKIFFEIPHINGSFWGGGFTAQNLVSLEPIYFTNGPIDYIHENHGYLLDGYRNSGFTTLTFGIDFHKDKFLYVADSISSMDSSESTLNNVKYERLLFRTGFEYKRIEKKGDFFKGFAAENEIIAGFVQWPRNKIAVIESETRYYAILGKWTNIAARFDFELSSNHLNNDQSFFIDDDVKLRHTANQSQRGTAGLTFNLEIRNQLLNKKKWGIQSALFADVGTWRPAGDSFSSMFSNEEVRESFIGAGIRLRTPFIMLRFDYGVDLLHSGETGFSFGIGQFF